MSCAVFTETEPADDGTISPRSSTRGEDEYDDVLHYHFRAEHVIRHGMAWLWGKLEGSGDEALVGNYCRSDSNPIADCVRLVLRIYCTVWCRSLEVKAECIAVKVTERQAQL
jgi:hypothetical protein